MKFPPIDKEQIYRSLTCNRKRVGSGVCEQYARMTGCNAIKTDKLPIPQKIVVVVFENHSYSQIVGNPNAPYINSLILQGALFSESYALTHPSQPNYISLFSGSNQGVVNNTCPLSLTAPNLYTALIAKGLTFKGFSDSLPSVGYAGCISGDYVRRHVPWINFTNIPTDIHRPFTDFPINNFFSLPTVSFVIPDLEHDMHDGTILEGDTWLHDNIDTYLDWAKANDGLLIITFDEDDGSEDNRIMTLFVGPMVFPGVYSEPINHFSVLRTIESLYNLQASGPATEQGIKDIWIQYADGLWIDCEGDVRPDFKVCNSPRRALSAITNALVCIQNPPDPTLDCSGVRQNPLHIYPPGCGPGGSGS